MKKYFKIFIFIMIIFLNFNVFASTTNVTNSIKYNVDIAGGTYEGDEIYMGGYNGRFNVNTRYNGRLSYIKFYLSTSAFNASTSHRYTITLNMATSDWRNHFMGPIVTEVNSDGSDQSHTLSVSNFRFISMKQIKFDFTTDSSLSPYISFTLYSTDYASTNSTAITGDTNWNLSSIIIDDNNSSSGSGSGSGSGSTFDDTGIINNNNQNTQDIINNANENTNTLNDSINDNCKNTTLTLTNDLSSSLNSYLDNNGDLHILSGASVSTYIKVRPNTTYTLKKITGGEVPSGFSYCLYNANKAYYRCGLMPTNQDEEITINVDSYTTFIRFSMKSYLVYQVKGYICNDFASEKLNEVNNSINNSTSNIIDNQNENTNNQIESQKVCSIIDVSDVVSNGYLSNSGQVNAGNSTAYGITNYIKISSSDTISVVKSTGDTFNYCFYNINRTVISCIRSSNNSVNTSISIPDNTSYVRFSFNRSQNAPQYNVCRNGNQSLNDNIDNLNDSINNSNVDSNTGTGFFDNFTSEDFGLSQIITIPLTAIQRLTSSSCSSLNIPIPFTNSTVPLPCMTQIYEQNIPSVYNLWKIVSFGIIGYFICLDIFHIVKGFKDPESDKVEVLDL